VVGKTISIRSRRIYGILPGGLGICLNATMMMMMIDVVWTMSKIVGKLTDLNITITDQMKPEDSAINNGPEGSWLNVIVVDMGRRGGFRLASNQALNCTKMKTEVTKRE